MIIIFKFTMTELKYRINSVTSQSSKYPAHNLLNNQEGWQSSINCQYPQSITIQFYVPIKTKKVHLLFHQYKIPTYIEVYVKLGCHQKYRKLGYIRPNDNSQSSFEEKQQKTLYFQFSCTHIRLVLHDNYKNDRNIFNQVAISDMIIIGEIVNIKQIDKDFQFDQSSDEDVSQSIEIHGNPHRIMQSSDQSNNKSYTNPIFKEIYIKLQANKREAVQREDYQRASHIKNALTNFKTLQFQLGRLQAQKNDAIKNQDYDKCHRFKNEILKKKQVIQYHKNMLLKNQEVFYNENSFSRGTQKQYSPQKQSKRKEYQRQIINFKSPEIQKKINQSVSNCYDEQVVPALRKKNKQSQHLPLETNQKRKDGHFEANQSIIPEVAQENDTSIKKQLNQLNQLTQRSNVENGGQLNQQLKKIQSQPLEHKLKMRLQNYFDFIPQKIWKLCENKNWKAKQMALKFMKEKIIFIQTKQHFMGTIQLISRVIVSKQATISIESIHLLNNICDLNIKFTLQHLPYFLQQILNELLNFLNDTNKQIKELAYTTYLKLPQISFLGIQIVAKELIKHKNKVKNDPKLIIIKLQLMNALIQRYGNQQIPSKEIVNWILVCFQDPNQKVRSQASQLMVALAFIIGNQKILKMIEQNKPQMMQLVLNMMNSSLQHSKIHHDVSQSKLNLDNSKLNNQFYGVDPVQQTKTKQIKNKSKTNKNEALQNPIYVLQSEQKYEIGRQQSKLWKNNDNANVNVNLSYSKQSIFEDSIQPNQNHYEGDSANQLDQDNPGICQYCNESYENMREHFMNDCDVLVFCDKCNGYLYLRTATQHLVNQCNQSHLFVECKKCGLAIERDQINEHIARGLCKKKRGVNWQRCQYCGCDILGEDKFWIQHSKECRNLPKKQVYFQGQSQLSNNQSIN